MSKGVHNIAFYVSPDPECSRTTQNSEISLAPSRGRILYAIYGNSTCVINHIVVTAIDKKYRNYYVSTLGISLILYSRYIVFEIFWGWGNEEVVVDLGIIKVKFHYVRKKRETKPKM